MTIGMSWCFTENNPEGCIDWEQLDELKRIRYAVHQHEVGEDGTPHFQGYVEFTQNVRLSYLKKLLPRAHWEKRRGSRDAARGYCMKADSQMDGPWEYGRWTPGAEGRRTDIWDLKVMVDKGATDLEIYHAMPDQFAKYHRMIDKIRPALVEPRRFKTEVHVLYGPPGTGKSVWVEHECGTDPKKVYYKPRNKWWNEYTGQENVVMDDFYGWLKYDDLLRLCDRFPLPVEVKGGMIQFTSKRIFITTNTHPALWYTNNKIKGVWKSFTRRVTKWYWCPEIGKQFVFEDYKDFEKVAPVTYSTE